MKALNSLLPQELNYAESPEMTAIQNALSAAMGDLWAARDGFAAQLSPATATWGLDQWEAALGLVPPDRRALDARRRAVIAKLRGAGTSTAERISRVAEAQLGGAVRVIEFARTYRIELWARDISVPDGGFAALTSALKELMPAHLRWSYGVEYSAAPFANGPDVLILRRFTAALAFSNWRGGCRFDGSSRFGDGLRFDQDGLVIQFRRFQIAPPAFRNREDLGGKIIMDNLYAFDGSIRFDGGRTFNAYIKEEEL